MKTVFVGMFSCAIFMLLCAFSCERNEVEGVANAKSELVSKTISSGFDPDNDVIARLVDGELTLVISQETLERAIRKANSKIESIKSYEFRIDADGGEEYGNTEVVFLLVYVNMRDGGHRTMAFDLKSDKNKVFYHVNMVTGMSSCDAFCCGKCQWSRPAGSSYYKCWCVLPTSTPTCGANGEEARCDHVLTLPKAEVIKKVD